MSITCEGGETHNHEEAADGGHGGEADGVARPGHGEGEQLPGNLVSSDSIGSIFAEYSVATSTRMRAGLGSSCRGLSSSSSRSPDPDMLPAWIVTLTGIWFSPGLAPVSSS